MRNLQALVRTFAALSIVATLASAPRLTAQDPTPPVAKAIARIDTLHGDVVTDNYFWIRDKTNPEVISYLNAENAYTTARMKHTEALQQKLYDEMLSRIKGRIVHKPLDHVSPLAVPVMLEIGHEAVYGDATEALLAEAEAELVKEAMQ